MVSLNDERFIIGERKEYGRMEFEVAFSRNSQEIGSNESIMVNVMCKEGCVYKWYHLPDDELVMLIVCISLKERERERETVRGREKLMQKE